MSTEFDLEMAVLAYEAYDPDHTNNSLLSSPSPWAPQDYPATLPPPYSGFGANVYKNGDDVVIAFRGTDQWIRPRVDDYLFGNVPGAAGWYSDQVHQAIMLVADVMDQYGYPASGINITFTGHSMGGGLASLMSVYFGLPAVVFDPAPFAQSALNVRVPIDYSPLLSPGSLFPYGWLGMVGTPEPSTLIQRYFDEYSRRQINGGRQLSAEFGSYLPIRRMRPSLDALRSAWPALGHCASLEPSS